MAWSDVIPNDLDTPERNILKSGVRIAFNVFRSVLMHSVRRSIALV